MKKKAPKSTGTKYPKQAKVPAQPEPTPGNPVRAHYKLATGGK